MEAGRFTKRILITAFFILFLSSHASSLFAAQFSAKSFTLKVNANVVSTAIKSVDVEEIDGYSRVQISGLSNYGKPGEPLLPYKTVKFLLPYGKEIDDVQVSSKRETIPGSYYVEPAQQALPLDFKGPVVPIGPDTAIYNSTNPFPGKQHEVESVQNLRGYKIAVINLFPVEYIPATGQLAYYENLTLNLKLKASGDSFPCDTYRGLEKDSQLVSESVDNPDAVSSYPLNIAAPLAIVDYLIITSDSFKAYSGVNDLVDLTDHKALSGLTTRIIDETGVNGWGAYSGLRPDDDTDNATRIRNCIRDNYKDNGTQYVLLVGDADYGDDDSGGTSGSELETTPIIPVRTLYVGSEIASDLYYACLGADAAETYDVNANSKYGETDDGPLGGDVDLTADVFVGRAPVDSYAELDNFVKKTIAYENSNASYLNKVIMAGEYLEDGVTYGGDYMEEIVNSTSANGYTTRGMGSTGFFGFERLYDKISNWTTADLVTKLNAGIHVLNHVGHALNTLLGKTFTNYEADTLTNTNYFLGYTQGCYSGAFDNYLEGKSWHNEDDCILEHFVTEAHGAFAFIGNSRSGWYLPGSTDGPSQRFHREFWDAVVYEGKTNLGQALQDSKQDNIGLVFDECYRKCYFTINLLGDPQTEIQGEYLAPTDFTAANVCVANKSWVSIRWVNSYYPGLTHTMIRYRTDGVYPANSSDGTLLVERAAARGAAELFNHTNVENGKTYSYVAFGYDGSTYEGNNGVNNRVTVTVVGGSSGTSTGRSDCFIATVCYGSKNSHEVKILRKFRDKVLVNTYAGKKFISLYYAVGPKLARWIDNKEALKKIVRKCLDPIAGCAESLMGGN